MKKLWILGLVALTLTCVTATLSAEPAVEIDTEAAEQQEAVVEIEETVEPADAPAIDGTDDLIRSLAGECAIGHTSSASSCESWCYGRGCGFDYWNSSNCTCYCGYQL